MIKGQNLAGPVSSIRVGEAELAPVPANIGNTQISLALTSATLRAGVQGVQVVYSNGAESNVAPLVLRPRITVDAPNVTDEEVPLDFQPSVGRRQRVTLYLNEFGAPPGRLPRAYSFPAPSNNGIEDPTVESTTSIAFAINAVEAGDYLVRVQVAGAESVLATDLTGRYPNGLDDAKKAAQLAFAQAEARVTATLPAVGGFVSAAVLVQKAKVFDDGLYAALYRTLVEGSEALLPRIETVAP